jgi:hypothetical protein
VNTSPLFCSFPPLFFLSISNRQIEIEIAIAIIAMVLIKSLASTALFASAAYSRAICRQTSTLNSLFVAAGKTYFGTATDQTLLQNTENEAIIKAQFGTLTPENSMKWDSIERKQAISWTQSLGSIDNLQRLRELSTLTSRITWYVIMNLGEYAMLLTLAGRLCRDEWQACPWPHAGYVTRSPSLEEI